MQKSKPQFKIQKYFKNYKLLTVVFSFSLLVFSLATPALAAVLYLEPAEGEYHRDDTFTVEARINTEGEYINTVKVDIAFSQDILEIKDFSKGNSILILWVEEPEFSNQNGTISFSGGIPGGYQGWNGLLGRIILKTKKQGTAELKFQKSSQVFLNDGLGTPADLKTRGAKFNILAQSSEKPINIWQEELEKDNVPPEPFEIEISQEPSIFEGKYFIIFSTTDKQTGLDYYEVNEGKNDWQRAESPHLLKDQGLKGIIQVRATDKAGNERIAEISYLFPEKAFPWWIIIVILIVIGVIWRINKKLRIKS